MGRGARRKRAHEPPDPSLRPGSQGLDKKDLYNAAAGSGESRQPVSSLLEMYWGDEEGGVDASLALRPAPSHSKPTVRPMSQMSHRNRSLRYLGMALRKSAVRRASCKHLIVRRITTSILLTRT